MAGVTTSQNFNVSYGIGDDGEENNFKKTHYFLILTLPNSRRLQVPWERKGPPTFRKGGSDENRHNGKPVNREGSAGCFFILRHRDEATRVKRETGEPVEAYALPIPSVRQCRYCNNSVYEKPTCNPDDVESIEDLLNRYHGDLHRGSQNPPPREVVVVKIEQWYTPAKRKSKRVKSEAPETRAKEPEPELNIIILSTPALLELCKAHKGASIDGTYRCAPGKSTRGLRSRDASWVTRKRFSRK